MYLSRVDRCHTCVSPSLRLNISETAGDRTLVTIESLWENGRTESIDDVTDDVTGPDDVIAVTSTAGAPR